MCQASAVCLHFFVVVCLQYQLMNVGKSARTVNNWHLTEIANLAQSEPIAKKVYILLAKNAGTVLPQAEPEPLKKENAMFQFVPREHFWIPLLMIVFCVLVGITSNLTREHLVTNARQIPPLQQRVLDLRMIVPINATMQRTVNLHSVTEMPIAFSIKTI
jgi:hypothetical protein